MVLSVEAFVKRVNCISCGQFVEASKKFCARCEKLMQEELELDEFKEHQSELVNKEEEDNDGSDDSR